MKATAELHCCLTSTWLLSYLKLETRSDKMPALVAKKLELYD